MKKILIMHWEKIRVIIMLIMKRVLMIRLRNSTKSVYLLINTLHQLLSVDLIIQCIRSMLMKKINGYKKILRHNLKD